MSPLRDRKLGHKDTWLSSYSELKEPVRSQDQIRSSVSSLESLTQAQESSNWLGKRAVPHSDSGHYLVWPMPCPHQWQDLEGWLVEQNVGVAMGPHCNAALGMQWANPTHLALAAVPRMKKSLLSVIKVLTCTTDNPKQKAVKKEAQCLLPNMFSKPHRV